MHYVWKVDPETRTIKVPGQSRDLTMLVSQRRLADGRWIVVVHTAGGAYWSGGAGNQYSPAAFTVFELDEKENEMLFGKDENGYCVVTQFTEFCNTLIEFNGNRSRSKEWRRYDHIRN